MENGIFFKRADPSRIALYDTLRGFMMILVIIFHTAFDLYWVFGKDFGFLSVLLQGRGRARILRRVEPANFKPVPKVMSATVMIEARPDPLPAGPEFHAFASLCFAQKRKMLYNTLSGAYPRDAVRAALAEMGVDETVRAEALSADRLFELFGKLGLPPAIAAGAKSDS